MIAHLIVGSIVVLPVFYVPTLTLGELAVCIAIAVCIGACWQPEM